MSINYVGVEPFLGWKDNREYFSADETLGGAESEMIETAKEAAQTDSQQGNYYSNPSYEDEKLKLNRISKEKKKIFDDDRSCTA